MIAPMLAKDVGEKPPRIPRIPGYVIEPKFDGWRWLMERTESGMRFYSGRNSKEHGKGNGPNGPLAEIRSVLEFLPPGTILDSELIADVENGIGSVLAQTPRGKGGTLTVFVFDVLRVADQDVMSLMWHQRREMFLERMAEEFEGPVKLVPVFDGDPEEQQEVHDRWLEQGMEGSIAKRRESKYRPGSRSRDWLKIKPQDSTEAVVIGYEMGKGDSNTHLVGALQIRLLETGYETSVGYEAPVEEIAGMMGKTLELRHHGWGSSGAVRHPVFKRWRPDRDEA